MLGGEGEVTKGRLTQLLVAAACLGLGLLLGGQARTRSAARQDVPAEDWAFVVADLVDSNARLREEVETLQIQLAQLDDVEGGGAILESLVDEVNHLRIINGWVGVSGQGVEVLVTRPISVLDLHDLINELRNAGAEALALNGLRIVVWSAIGSDGEHVTVDGQPVRLPYRLHAIGDAETLEAALLRPGGLIDLLDQANKSLPTMVRHQDKLSMPVYSQRFQFAYAKPVE